MLQVAKITSKDHSSYLEVSINLLLFTSQSSSDAVFFLLIDSFHERHIDVFVVLLFLSLFLQINKVIMCCLSVVTDTGYTSVCERVIVFRTR